MQQPQEVSLPAPVGARNDSDRRVSREVEAVIHVAEQSFDVCLMNLVHLYPIAVFELALLTLLMGLHGGPVFRDVRHR